MNSTRTSSKLMLIPTKKMVSRELQEDFLKSYENFRSFTNFFRNNHEICFNLIFRYFLIIDESQKLYKNFKGHFKCAPCNKKTFADLSSLARHFAVFHSNDLKKKQKILEREKFRQDFLNMK